MDEYRLLNTEGLRYEDEFVKHKVLDAIGDLYLLGAPADRRVRGAQVRARLNNRLARALLARSGRLEIVMFERVRGRPAIERASARQPGCSTFPLRESLTIRDPLAGRACSPGR